MSTVSGRGTHLARWIMWPGAGVLLLFVACGTRSPESGPKVAQPVDRGELHPERVVRGSLSESAIDRFRIELKAGDSLLLEATQEDVDLVLTVLGPGAHEPASFDYPPGTMAPERVCQVARKPGMYKVDISPYAGAGSYTLRVVHVRPATESDRLCSEAASAFASAREERSRAARLEKAVHAARLWEASGEVMLAAVAWREVGWLRLDRGESGGGIGGLERALSLASRAGERRLETSILNRLGLAYRDGGALLRASEALERSLVLARESGDLRGTASALTNQGLLDNEMGQPHRALARLREALQMWRELGDLREIAQVLVNLATVLGALDHHEEALDLLEEGLELARRAGDSDREAVILTEIGWIRYLQGEPDLGVPPLRRALRLRREEDDARGEAGVLDRLGTVLYAAGDRATAEEAYQASLRLSKRMDLPAYTAATENNLGCLLAESERSHEAEAYFARALDYFEDAGDPKSRAHVEYCRARLARSRGDLDGALEHVRQALAIVERLRDRARTAGHRYQPIWLWQDYAGLELELLLERYRTGGDPRDVAAAFTAADRIRARSLYELMVLTRGGAEVAAKQVLEHRADQLRGRLNWLGAKRRALLAASPTPESRTELDEEIRRLRLQLQSVRGKVRGGNRGAGQLVMPRPITVLEVQRLLDPHTTLLTYVFGSERSHLFSLTRDRLEVFELHPPAVIETYAEALHNALKQSRSPGGQWLLLSSALGRLLLPSESIPPETKRLMISPEGMLSYVPFAVLGSPRAMPSEDPADRLVLDDFEVVTIPSAAVLAMLRTRRQMRREPARTVAVFADPVFSIEDPRMQGGRAAGPRQPTAERPMARDVPPTVTDHLPSGPWPRLHATRDEAAAIRSLVPEELCFVRLGPEATKEAVLSADLDSYRILHFATHAWIDERFPELSGLVLSAIDETGESIDGTLYLHEIDRLNLVADLTVLSGCQTALGRRVRGDGLVGLTQGFLQAGSDQVLVSLWSLDDSAAARLMAELYRRMLDGDETPAAALRHAQQWLREQDGFQAPRFWAPFVLQGDG